MKTVFAFVLMLGMLGVLPACRPYPDCPQSCGWVPFTTVRVTYRLATTIIEEISVPGNGCIIYNSRGLQCTEPYITVMGRRRSSFFGLFSAAPDSINLQSPPGSMTIYGYGISSAYGMPTVECIDPYGRRVSSTAATAVAGDGSWVQISLPDLTRAYSGQFQVLIVNKTWDGGQEEIGYSPVNLWGRDRVDADGDGWYIDEDCNDNDPSVNPAVSPDCSSSFADKNCNGIWDNDDCNAGGGTGGGDDGGGCPTGYCNVY